MDSFQALYHVGTIEDTYLESLVDRGIFEKTDTSNILHDYIFDGVNIFIVANSKIIRNRLINDGSIDIDYVSNRLYDKLSEHFNIISSSYIGFKSIKEPEIFDRTLNILKMRNDDVTETNGRYVSFDQKFVSGGDGSFNVISSGIILSKDGLSVGGLNIHEINRLCCELYGVYYDGDEYIDPCEIKLEDIEYVKTIMLYI